MTFPSSVREVQCPLYSVDLSAAISTPAMTFLYKTRDIQMLTSSLREQHRFSTMILLSGVLWVSKVIAVA